MSKFVYTEVDENAYPSIKLKAELFYLGSDSKFLTDQETTFLTQDNPDVIYGTLVWLISRESVPKNQGKTAGFLQGMRALALTKQTFTIPQMRSLVNCMKAWVQANYKPFPEGETPAKGKKVELVTSVQGLDLREVPKGRYAVPDSEGPLIKIDAPTDGKWGGWIFVKDGSRYVNDKPFGRQEPGQGYVGQYQQELTEIAKDPIAAAARYGQLTGYCGRCGRILEDAKSIRIGLGPSCAKIAGY